MQIDRERCTCCGECIAICPVSAIRLRKKDTAAGLKAQAVINRDECVECSACFRSNVCPEGAIQEEPLEWPRILRKAFSDPVYTHKGTDIPGRGTEEMKTNDVTGRFRDGFIGIGLEFGRPGVGARFRDAEKAIRKLLPLGVQLEPKNPLTQLIADPATGALQPEVLNEKVLSTIVEAIIPVERFPEVVAAVHAIAAEADTVISFGVISKVAPDGSVPAVKAMQAAGLTPSINGKVNVGLGRPLFPF
jgi:NAD-dependent dihydropyrimidine dehydrogenase PreA subunit